MIKITFKWGEVAPAYLAACLHIVNSSTICHLHRLTSGVCAVFDTSIWKGSVCGWQECECSVSLTGVEVRAAAARPALRFMLSGAYLGS